MSITFTRRQFAFRQQQIVQSWKLSHCFPIKDFSVKKNLPTGNNFKKLVHVGVSSERNTLLLPKLKVGNGTKQQTFLTVFTNHSTNRKTFTGSYRHILFSAYASTQFKDNRFLVFERCLSVGEIFLSKCLELFGKVAGKATGIYLNIQKILIHASWTVNHTHKIFTFRFGSPEFHTHFEDEAPRMTPCHTLHWVAVSHFVGSRHKTGHSTLIVFALRGDPTTVSCRQWRPMFIDFRFGFKQNK